MLDSVNPIRKRYAILQPDRLDQSNPGFLLGYAEILKSRFDAIKMSFFVPRL